MTPGALIAKGRSADIFEYGDGKVLRRLRDGRQVAEAEPAVMGAVRAAGFPVPEVFEIDGPDMVMERVAGVDMVKDIERRPWRARRYGRILADLHRRLSEIPCDGAHVPQAYGAPEVYVHGDLHPGEDPEVVAGGGDVGVDSCHLVELARQPLLVETMISLLGLWFDLNVIYWNIVPMT